MPRIDINQATAEELTPLPGIGDALAKAIVADRERNGPFERVAELARVSGVSEALVARLRDRLAAEPPGDRGPDGPDGEEASSPEPFVFRVLLKSASGGDFAGHRVAVEGMRQGEDDAGPLPFAVSRGVDADATARFDLPPRSSLAGEVRTVAQAPDGAELAEDVRAAEKLPPRLELDVEPAAPVAPRPNDDPAAAHPQRLRGRVIDEAGRSVPSGLQVVLWGAQVESPQDSDFRALVVTSTDPEGHFGGPYPLGTFTAAHATVAVGEAPATVDVHLVEGEFPESVVLVVSLPEPKPFEEDECACHDPAEVPRSPDATDLARADGTFSSDRGSDRCVDFTKPNRTLEEFGFSYAVRTTEPEIRGLTFEEPPKIDFDRIKELIARPSFGMEMSPVALRGTPALATTAASVSLPSNVKLDARVVETLARDPDGFSLTKLAVADRLTRHRDLLRILKARAPRPPTRKELTCANPVDWDDDPTIYQACTIAHGHLLRFKQEWVSDGYSLGNLLYSLPLAPGQKKQIAVVDWERREEAVRSESLTERERLDAFVDRDRDVSEIVRGTLRESIRGGSKSSSGAVGGGLGIGVIYPPVGGLLGIGGGHSSASSSAFQRSSRSTASSALQQLRDRTVQSASAVRSQRASTVQSVRQGERVMATTETVANYNHCHAITVQYFEVLRHLLSRERLADVQECLFVPLLMARFGSDKALRWRYTLEPAVPRALRRGFAALDRIDSSYAGSDLPEGRYADEELLEVDGELRLRFQLTRPRDVDDDFAMANWVPILKLFGFDPQDFYDNFLEGQRLKDRIFVEQLGPRIATAVIDLLRIHALRADGSEVDLEIDPTLVSDFANDRSLYVTLRMGGDLSGLRRSDVKAVVVSSRLRLPGLPFVFDALPAGSRVIVESGTLRYRTAHDENLLFRDRRIQNDLVGRDDVRIPTPLDRKELRNPREEDKEYARNLLDHLNEHIERYHHVVWGNMSADRRYMLLDGFEAPNSGGRSVASVVENELAGIVGNCLVLPVAPGFHLDPTFAQDVEDPIDLLDHYQPNTPIEPTRFAVPTRGVYAEAVMGACNSCEEMDEMRFWRWQEAPIPDAPTAIQPVSTDTRRAEPGDLTPQPLPAPIVAMQNAPTAPDPTGLGAVLNLLGKGDSFRDFAGLAGTQKNAAAALEGAFKTATTFGTKAADLALQGRMTRDIDKALRKIQDARSQGLIDDEQASDLTEKALTGLVGAGPTNPKKTTSTKQVEELTKTAGEQKASVKVTRPTGEEIEVDARKLQDIASGAEDLLKQLFGLGNASAPKSRPNKSADKLKALAAIRLFRGGTGAGAWNKMSRSAVADRLEELLQKPWDLDQGQLGVCGPAVFFQIWIREDPLAFTNFAIELYEKGSSRIGSLHVKAGSDLLAQDFGVLKPKVGIAAADWMVQSALRDSENAVLDFEGTPQEDFSGGTSGPEVASWLRATGLFSRVSDDTALLGSASFVQARTLRPTANRICVMYIDTSMISTSRAKGKSKHFVELTTPLQVSGGQVGFDYWTWSDPPRSASMTQEHFEDRYLGSITAEY